MSARQDGPALSPETKKYIAMRERGERLPSRRDLQRQLMECEDALRATEAALAALPPSAPLAVDVRGGCYFCGATGIAPHAGCRGGNVPLPGDEDIERWYAAFAKVSGLDAKRLPGKRVIWERFAAEYARLQEQDR